MTDESTEKKSTECELSSRGLMGYPSTEGDLTEG
jgi:hypothetical protein